MDLAIARLQTVARRAKISGALGPSEQSRIMARLSEVADELDTLERRSGSEKADPVDIAALLHEIADSPATKRAGGISVQAPQGLALAGPAADLRELICSLAEYALAVAREPVEIHAQVKYAPAHDRPTCALELLIQSPDVADFLRQKLWHAARVRRGQVSIVSEANCSRVELSLPLERRAGTILG
jgi:hypothetical protein